MDEDLALDLWRMLHESGLDPKLTDTSKQAVELCLRRAPEINAVWHPLGFMMMRLAALPEGSLRLHLWTGHSSDNDQARGSVHEHRWSLASYVICGSLRNSVLKISEVNAETDANMYQLAEIRHMGREDFVRPTGSYVVPKMVSEVVYASGDRYFLAPRVFHSTDLLVTPCATLVGETTGSGGPSRSLSSFRAMASRAARRIVSQRELETALGDVLKEVGG